MCALVPVVALIALVGLIGPVDTTPSAPGRSFFVGVDDDLFKWGRARSAVAVASTVGLRAVRVTVPWHASEFKVPSAERRQLEDAIVPARSLRVVLAVYGRADEAPLDDAARSAYCSYVSDLLRVFKTVRDVVIWNEPNSPAFWLPQYEDDGTSAAPAAYEALLADCWTMLHSAHPGVNVIAASAPRGNDGSAAASNASHSPGTWYRLLGRAYRESGRDEPILDTVGHNPYPDFSAERPWTKHRSHRTIGQGDHARLTEALEDAFEGTAQALPGEGAVTIWYLEQGFQTAVEPGKRPSYTGRETDRFALPAWSLRAGSRNGNAPDQATQLVDAIRLAYCQSNVGAYFNFLLVDEPDLRGWQSGVFWADWTPKPSFPAFREAVHEVNEGMIDCTALGRVTTVPRPEATTGLEISDVRVRQPSPFAATVSWRTSVPVGTSLAYGLRGSVPTLWHFAERIQTEHRVQLSGLSLKTPYRVWLSAIGPAGQEAGATVDFTTPYLSRRVHASIAERMGVLLLDGEPFFPLMVWNQCPDEYERSLATGINLFAENPCGDLQDQLDALSGRALSAGVSGREGGTDPALIGYFHPDEADGLGLTAQTLPKPPPGTDRGVSFLTLTNHFYSGADPLAWGRAMYPALVGAADVVGFDLYPLQEWCRADRLPDVYLAQRELAALARGKPTFQWIEAAEWRCPGGPTAVTADTVRAEAWLAIAGGARGLGFFPASWSPTVREAIAQVSRDIASLGDALFSFRAEAVVTSPPTPVYVSARTHLGALYVIAVNASRDYVDATIRSSQLDGRRLHVLAESRTVSAEGDTFSDHFGPLAVHVYIAPPAGA